MHLTALNLTYESKIISQYLPAPAEDPPRTAMVGVPSNEMHRSRVRRRYFIVKHPNVKFTLNSFSGVGDEMCRHT